ncbi:MAG: hypothetical protein GX333_07215, partial [Syntrophomonadaceae bacterium]|nr:hypothetical protein [Syntrophomonadaceae bacterium]
TFSYNNIIGIRTPDKGFIKGLISSKSKYPIYKYGGGICMTSSILHQAVKSTDLPILERHNHVANVGYLPRGEDAAITWGVEDYRFYNNLAHPLIIKTHINSGLISISLYEELPTPTIYLGDRELLFIEKPFIEEGISYAELKGIIDNFPLTAEMKEILLITAPNSPITITTPENKHYIPLRVITAFLNYEISWDAEKETIRLTLPAYFPS